MEGIWSDIENPHDSTPPIRAASEKGSQVVHVSPRWDGMVYDVWRGRWRLVVGDVESESMALVPLDEGEELADEPMVDHESNLMDSLELATTILHRLRPANSHELGQMVFRNAVASGVLLMALILFWWLTVTVFASELGSESAIDSLIFSLNFKWVAALVPTLVFTATALMKLSRERSQPWPGLFAGSMLILALFLSIEPLGHLTFGGAPVVLMLHSARLFVLAVMVHYCASMFLDALLLRWVHDLSNEFDIFEFEDASGEGQAEEAAPAA